MSVIPVPAYPAKLHFAPMHHDGAIPAGTVLVCPIKGRAISAVVQRSASGVSIVSAPDSSQEWPGGIWKSPSGFSSAVSNNQTDGWMKLRVGSIHGPPLDFIRGLWALQGAAAAKQAVAAAHRE